MKKLFVFILLLPVWGFSQEYHSTKQAVVLDVVDTLYYTYKDVVFQIVPIYRANVAIDTYIVGYDLNMYEGSNMYAYEVPASKPVTDELGMKYECFDKVFMNKIDFIMSDDRCIYVRFYKSLNKRKFKVVKIVKYFL